jgi:hypothetical protein
MYDKVNKNRQQFKEIPSATTTKKLLHRCKYNIGYSHDATKSTYFIICDMIRHTVLAPNVLKISTALPDFLELNTASASLFQVANPSAAVLTVKKWNKAFVTEHPKLLSRSYNDIKL